MSRVLIFKNRLSPGDVLAMTAAVYSLHKKHPGRFLTAVDTSAPALWENNPDVISLDEARRLGAEEVQTHYPAVQESNQRLVHFLGAYCEFFEHALQVPVPLLTDRPVLRLTAQEKAWVPQVEEVTRRRTRYWVVCAGRKHDFTAKFWGTANYQKVVDLLKGRVLFVQVGAAEHHHPPLRDVINLVGKTDLRQLARVVHHADGVLCGVTLLHHVAAALSKPSVVLLGGREPVAWNSYPKAQLMHAVGLLPCCREGGCWKSRTVLLGDGSEQDGSLCEDPVWGDEPLPRCLALQNPEEAARRILLFQA